MKCRAKAVVMKMDVHDKVISPVLVKDEGFIELLVHLKLSNKKNPKL